jgi:phage shock protein PspC (stress-responsive transcriptional regulator)
VSQSARLSRLRGILLQCNMPSRSATPAAADELELVMASSIIARDDTLLGACYALGEDFGFNPLYLRILFAFAIFWSPAVAFVAYAALTALVTLTRWLVPDPASAEAAAPEAWDRRDEPVEDLRLAA